ncbi:MAG TPA: DUF2628 domain-containing protein [Pseudorhizobium sp.]|nr:DUF2628 domain-containing protein [Pseudorhizobium sp.]
MKSYLVLTPPGGPDPDHQRTVFLADRFTWLALFFPWIWLLTKRLWLAAVLVFLLQLLAAQLMQMQDIAVVGALLALSVNLAVALEGRHFYSETLLRRGWRIEAIITAGDPDTAEEIYFSQSGPVEQPGLPVASDWSRRTTPRPHLDWAQSGIGLFDQSKGQ